MGGVLKTGRGARLLITHGGQRQVVAGDEMGDVVALHDGEQWRRYNRNGSTTRMPNWDDDSALAHGEKRALQDSQRKETEAVRAVRQTFRDRRA